MPITDTPVGSPPSASGYASVQVDDFTVESNMGDEAQLRAALDLSEPKPDPKPKPTADAAALVADAADAVAVDDTTTEPAADADQERNPDGTFKAKPKAGEGDPRKDPHAKIGLLTKAQKDAERALEAERGRTARLEAELAEARRPKEPLKPAPRETFEPFEQWQAKTENADRAYEEYLDERAEWRADRRFEQKERERQDREARAAADKAWTAFRTRETTFKANHADHDDVITQSPMATVPLLPWVIDVIRDSEHGPALRYYLAQHVDELQKILDLEAVAAVRELTKIETRLIAAPSGPAQTPTRSQAKPVMKPVTGSATTATDDGPPGDDASLDEHVAHYNRQDREARRRR